VDGAHGVRGTVTVEGRPAAATLHADALEGFDWLFEGRPPAAGSFEAFLRLEAPATRGPRREVVVPAGSFAIEGLARGVYRVRAFDGEGRRAMGFVLVGGVQAPGPLELRLVAHGERLEGFVRWSDGSPVAGAVAVEPGLTKPSAGFLEGDPVGPFTLDAQGRFVAEGLPSGPIVVRVKTTDGTVAIDRSARVPRSEPWTLTLERPAVTVRGHVVSSVGDVGVSGARILCVHTRGGEDGGTWHAKTTQSALDGAFELAVVALPAKLIVLAEGYARAESQVPDDRPQRIVLSPLSSIGGRVVSARGGGPAAGAIVRYDVRENSGQATCRDDGTFELVNVPPPEAHVFVWGGGWVQASPDPSTSPGRKVALTPGARAEVELEAVPSTRLEVRVLDAAGAPVPGVQVDLMRFLGEGGSGGQPPHRAGARGHSDAAGLAVLTDVPTECDLWLAARAERIERVESGPHRAGGGPIEIRLGATRWVDLTVLHADDGTPAVGARVTWIARSGSGSSSRGGPRTDEMGKVRLGPIKDERYFVQVLGGAGFAASEEVPLVVPPGSSGDIALTIRAAREVRLEGRVLFPDGTPAPRVGLRLQGDEASQRGARPATTGPRGEFVVGGLRPGEHTLVAEHSVGDRVYRGSWRVTAGRHDLELRLEDASAEWVHIAVEVLDPEGRPVEQAEVHLLDGLVNHASVGVSQGKGWVRFKVESPQATALAAGRVVPLAMSARRRDGTRLPYGRVRGAPLGPAERSVTLRLPPERVIEGRVVDAAGASVADATLELEPLTMWSGSNPTEPSVQSDAQGRFRFGGLGDEPMRLKVQPPGDFLAPEPFEVVPGGREALVRLTRGVSARVKVLDPDGRPVAQAQVVVQPVMEPNRTHEEHLAWHARLRRTQRQAATGADGVALLRGIEPGVSMTLSVTPPFTREDLNGANLSPWTVADTEVRLEGGLEVRGVVRDGEGRPLPHAVVYVADAPHSWQGHAVAPDGTFRLTRLRPGPVALKAVAHRDQRIDPLAPPLATVDAGRRDVVLVLAAPVTLVVEVEGDAAPAPGADPAPLPFGPVQLLASFAPGSRIALLSVQARREGARYVFDGLEPGLVTVWVRPDAEGRYGLMHDVPTDGGLVRVRRQPGRRITGRVVAPAGVADLRVSAVGVELQVRVDGVLRPDGSYEIVGLPPGRWSVDAQARDATGWLQARGEADAGGTLDLRIEQAR
jgi:protocatechuate 3,4-dioxygenase beta subunit